MNLYIKIKITNKKIISSLLKYLIFPHFPFLEFFRKYHSKDKIQKDLYHKFALVFQNFLFLQNLYIILKLIHFRQFFHLDQYDLTKRHSNNFFRDKD